MRIFSLMLSILLALLFGAFVQTANADEEKDEGPMSSPTFKGLELRNIGPAFMSGRISDIQIGFLISKMSIQLALSLWIHQTQIQFGWGRAKIMAVAI